MVYKVTVTEFVSEDFFVNADDPKDAALFIAEMYDKQDILVSADSAFSVRYDSIECPDYKEEADFDIVISEEGV